jgi:hypothetical protein
MDIIDSIRVGRVWKVRVGRFVFHFAARTGGEDT